jgi:hypothetical protein
MTSLNAPRDIIRTAGTFLVLIGFAGLVACQQSQPQKAESGESSKNSGYSLFVTAFPPDADLSFELKNGSLQSNAPARLSFKEKPIKVKAGRKGYLESVVDIMPDQPADVPLHIELKPDPAQAKNYLDQAKTVDELVDYLLIFPALADAAFYNKLNIAMAERAKIVSAAEVDSLAGPPLLKQDGLTIMLRGAGSAPGAGGAKGGGEPPKPFSASAEPEGYALYGLSPKNVPVFVFERHPKKLLDLSHALNGPALDCREAGLISLAWSNCDCYQFQAALSFRIQGSRLEFQSVSYQEIVKGEAPKMLFHLDKEIK